MFDVPSVKSVGFWGCGSFQLPMSIKGRDHFTQISSGQVGIVQNQWYPMAYMTASGIYDMEIHDWQVDLGVPNFRRTHIFVGRRMSTFWHRRKIHRQVSSSNESQRRPGRKIVWRLQHSRLQCVQWWIWPYLWQAHAMSRLELWFQPISKAPIMGT
jgi:hypothetical protein